MGFFSTLLAKLTGADAARKPATRKHDPVFWTASPHDTPVATFDPPGSERRTAFLRIDDAPSRWWAPVGVTRTEPAELPARELTAEARALENLLISHFDGHDLTLPPLLNGAERVLVKLRDPKCNYHDVAAIVAEDPVIAAAVLRVANSALYRGLQKITSLPAALNRLGFNTLRTLMLRESLRAAMFDRRGAADNFAGLIWKRSLACATIMQGLSRFTKVPPDDAFLYGLLHDIGNVVVLRIIHDRAASTTLELDTETFEYLCSVCHQEFGELIADAWKLPSDLKALIADHHTHPEDDELRQVERLQLLLADMITSLLGYAPGEPFLLLESRVTRALELAHRSDFISFLEGLPEELEDVLGTA